MTAIQWTDEVWNPVVGCSRVSSGCDHCYAINMAHRGMSPAHRGLTKLRPKDAARPGVDWTGDVRLLEGMLGRPLRWRAPRRVFVNSMTDLFHHAVPFPFIAAVFGAMASCPQHTFQVLTKRPERALEFFRWIERRAEDGKRLFPDEDPAWRIGQLLAVELNRAAGVSGYVPGKRANGYQDFDPRRAAWPLQNVHLGVSVEDQATADERIPLLLQIPSVVRWVSYEPAIGGVDFTPWMWPTHWCWDARFKTPEDAIAEGATATRTRQRLVLQGSEFIDWIVIGGESGPGARPFDLAWARSLIKQVSAAGVPLFIKQLGARPVIDGQPVELQDRKGGDMDEWPSDLRVRQPANPKHQPGRAA